MNIEVLALIDEALTRWNAIPVPRPPMPALGALQFAYDWPASPTMPARCCSCSRDVDAGHLMRHMDADHPGWLDAWNEALRSGGVVR